MAEVTSQPTQRFLDFHSGKSTFLNFIPIPSATLGPHWAFPTCPSTHHPSLGENRHRPLPGCEIPPGSSHSPSPPCPVLPPSTLKTAKLSVSLGLLMCYLHLGHPHGNRKVNFNPRVCSYNCGNIARPEDFYLVGVGSR